MNKKLIFTDFDDVLQCDPKQLTLQKLTKVRKSIFFCVFAIVLIATKTKFYYFNSLIMNNIAIIQQKIKSYKVFKKSQS